MTFSEALNYLRSGKKISRSGWNGKGMFLFYVGGWDIIKMSPTIAKEIANLEILPFIAMKTADNKLVPWLASQTDILADDWGVM